MKLRPYQEEAVQAVLRARRGGVRRQVISLPTGSGKTVIFSRLAAMARKPVLVLAHRGELLEQAGAKLEAAGAGPVSFEWGARRADPGAKTVVASIRSLSSERLGRLLSAREPGLVIYDECHHAPAEDNQRVLRELGAFDPDWPGTLLGFTATTSRGDGLGLDAVFEELVYQRTLPQMIGEGYLVGLRGFRVSTQADLRELSAGGKDFLADELAEAVDVEERNDLVARSIQELARGRRTIAFCANVAHAQHLAGALRELGVRAATVHGELPSEERAARLADFRASKLQVLTNVAVLTEGFDDPAVSCVAMARPTRSSGLYAQCVGRGTRLAPDKRDCLVLDFVDLSGVELETLPSLFGLPRQLDLRGGEVGEAAATYQQLRLDFGPFELPPDEITLEEIQTRAAAFDPLSLRVDGEVRAISPYAWCSLGRAGIALHVLRSGRVRTYRVLERSGRGRRYRVELDGKEQARFGTLEEAVEAVDYEVGRRGRKVAASAYPSAEWRQRPAPAPLRERFTELAPRRRVGAWGAALRLAEWLEHGGSRRDAGLGQRSPTPAAIS